MSRKFADIINRYYTIPGIDGATYIELKPLTKGTQAGTICCDINSDLNKARLPTLKTIAREMGIKGFSTMKKPDLLTAINSIE